MVKVFEVQKNGKIEFTKDELEKLLNEVYNDAYNKGKYEHNYWTWTSSSPTITLNRGTGETPYYTTTATNVDSVNVRDCITNKVNTQYEETK